MEQEKKETRTDFIKVDTYKEYDVYVNDSVPKESIATMMPDGINIAKAIAINPEAYEILKSRPDYLKRIYEHEFQENVIGEGIDHKKNKDILKFLKDNGYDFGNFKPQE